MKSPSPIEQASLQYAEWLGKQTFVVESDLEHKYRKMRSDPSGFIFFRGSFFRWARLWERKRKELRERKVLLSGAPEIFSIGDLHVENFGTWRDGEGRLIWGVNDVDEAYWMRYQNDLVRLASSALFAMEQTRIPLPKITAEKLCTAILEGYLEALQTGGKPFIMERQIPWLWKIATHPTRTPEQFCQNLEQKVKPGKHGIPDAIAEGASEALRALAPAGTEGSQLFRRRAGVGSLGRPRLVQFFTGVYGQVIRETKAVVPSAGVFLGWGKPVKNAYRKVLRNAVRVQDPIFGVFGTWVCRRLAFDSDRIDLDSLRTIDEVENFFRAMGFETANIHLGDPSASDIKRHLQLQNGKRPDWLMVFAREMVKSIKNDFDDYLNSDFGREEEPKPAPPAKRRAKKTK